MTESTQTVTDERGKELLAPEEIDTETALEVVEALEPILDEGDWRRLTDALQLRANNRLEGAYKYTRQDRNLSEKFLRVQEVREKRDEYRELERDFGPSETQRETNGDAEMK